MYLKFIAKIHLSIDMKHDMMNLNNDFNLDVNQVCLVTALMILIYCLLLDIELAISFLIGRKRTVIFEIRARDVITADYTIIMSRALKVTGNHVMYDRGA